MLKNCTFWLIVGITATYITYIVVQGYGNGAFL